MQFDDRRVYVVLALALLVVVLLISLQVENSRFGMSLTRDQAERAGRRGGRHQHLALEDAGADAGARDGGGRRRVLRRRPAGVTPESVFGMLVSAQALILALFGGVGVFWGPVIGAAVLVPLAERAERRTGAYSSGHPGRRLRRRDHRDHSAGAGGRLLARPRSVRG